MSVYSNATEVGVATLKKKIQSIAEYDSLWKCEDVMQMSRSNTKDQNFVLNLNCYNSLTNVSVKRNLNKTLEDVEEVSTNESIGCHLEVNDGLTADRTSNDFREMSVSRTQEKMSFNDAWQNISANNGERFAKLNSIREQAKKIYATELDSLFQYYDRIALRQASTNVPLPHEGNRVLSPSLQVS